MKRWMDNMKRGAEIKQNTKDFFSMMRQKGTDVSTALVILIDKGIDVNMVDERGFTPLMAVAFDGKKEPTTDQTVPAYLETRESIAGCLIMAGADIHAKNRDGLTARELAEQAGNTSIAELLQQLEKAVADKKKGHAGRIERNRGSNETQIG